MEITSATPYRTGLVDLLQNAKLPVEDLPETLDGFVVALDGDEVIGAAGAEKYGQYGLLRSVVVKREFRGQGIARLLIERIGKYAASQNISKLFLLTETASDYFERKGFVKISRDEVPEALKASSEFAHVCPVSAIVMFQLLIP